MIEDKGVVLDTRQKWVSYGAKYSWPPPPEAAWPYRLPIVRLVRYFYLAWLVEGHYLMWRHMGFALRSGYDDWVLFGILHGYV